MVTLGSHRGQRPSPSCAYASPHRLGFLLCLFLVHSPHRRRPCSHSVPRRRLRPHRSSGWSEGAPPGDCRSGAPQRPGPGPGRRGGQGPRRGGGERGAQQHRRWEGGGNALPPLRPTWRWQDVDCGGDGRVTPPPSLHGVHGRARHLRGCPRCAHATAARVLSSHYAFYPPRAPSAKRFKTHILFTVTFRANPSHNMILSSPNIFYFYYFYKNVS